MPGWLVTVACAALVALILFAAGGSEPVVILTVVAVWFVLLAAFALAVEVAIQAIGRLLRRGP